MSPIPAIALHRAPGARIRGPASVRPECRGTGALDARRRPRHRLHGSRHDRRQAVDHRFQLSADKLSNLPARYDAGWYGGIALDGYSFGGNFDRQQNIAFFPAFPMLMRASAIRIGAFGPGMPKEKRVLRLLWGGRLPVDGGLRVGVGISLAACARHRSAKRALSTRWRCRRVSVFALLQRALHRIALSARRRRRDVSLPPRRMVQAGAWGLLVGLTRPNGCFLSVVLARVWSPSA